MFYGHFPCQPRWANTRNYQMSTNSVNPVLRDGSDKKWSDTVTFSIITELPNTDQSSLFTVNQNVFIFCLHFSDVCLNSLFPSSFGSASRIITYPHNLYSFHPLTSVRCDCTHCKFCNLLSCNTATISSVLASLMSLLGKLAVSFTLHICLNILILALDNANSLYIFLLARLH